MASDDVTSRDPLFARADRAIADASATRFEVRRRLIAAGRMRPRRAWNVDPVPIPEPPCPLPWLLLEPWWSGARTLAAADAILREADGELERAWRRALPTIETPSPLTRP